MTHIPVRLRQQVVERASGRCEYCQTQQVIVVSMVIDHIVPEASGGETAFNNLCLSCVGCNAFKLSFQTGTDPDTGSEAPLYHPRTQLWTDHFQWSVDSSMLVGLTASGRATIERLRMNRTDVVQARRRWVAAGGIHLLKITDRELVCGGATGRSTPRTIRCQASAQVTRACHKDQRYQRQPRTDVAMGI